MGYWVTGRTSSFPNAYLQLVLVAQTDHDHDHDQLAEETAKLGPRAGKVEGGRVRVVPTLFKH